jgi:hypothetical protein
MALLLTLLCIHTYIVSVATCTYLVLHDDCRVLKSDVSDMYRLKSNLLHVSKLFDSHSVVRGPFVMK